MKLIRVGAAVLNTTPMDWDANQAAIGEALTAARRAGVGILCLPEMCICGYGCEDAYGAPGLRRMAREVLEHLVPQTQGLAACFGLPVLHNNALFNCVALAADGRLLGFVAKRWLAGEGLHYEPRWFKPWPEGRRDEVRYDGKAWPIGDLVFDVGGVRIGFEICEDAWVARRPASRLALEGCDVILNPSASHFAFGKLAMRRQLVAEASRAFGVTYIYSNLLGNEAGRAIYDGGALIASGGVIRAAGPRLTYDAMHLTTAVVDVDATRTSQARSSGFVPSVGPDELRIVADLDYPAAALETGGTPVDAWETGPHVRYEEFTRALTLGLYDYMRKSRSKGFVVSLSGGADSAACSCLVALMARRLAAKVGLAEAAARLGFADAADERALIGRLLTCAYQATAHSGDVTRNAASGLARALGATYYELDVDPLVRGYIGMIEGAIGRALSWETDDIALQNIQARVRSPGVWMLANLKGALLLATSNRSEAAVGYATMDGDTSGGLSPIAGIDKAFLRRYLRWLEAEGPEGLGAIPALKAVNAQQPTAELRPAEQNQTDEADLMPYDLLDAIEAAAIRDKLWPAEVLQVVRVQFPQYSPQQLTAWIKRFFRLFCRNQWKRERYAPSFHVDDKNLDPKTWCRFPILSGGFDRELRRLDDGGGS